MEERTELLSSEESRVFFYQDIFKLSSEVSSLPLMSLSTCWSEALDQPHDATTQADRTGKGARFSSTQIDKSALMSA